MADDFVVTGLSIELEVSSWGNVQKKLHTYITGGRWSYPQAACVSQGNASMGVPSPDNGSACTLGRATQVPNLE